MRRCMLLIPILAACGGSEPTTPPPVSKQLSLAIVGGNQQAAPVTSLLPVPIKVQVTESPAGALRIQRIDGLSLSGTPGSTPAPGRLVKFVPDSGCGSAAVGYGITDTLGMALDRWTLGMRAQPCTMRTIGVNQKTGEIEAYDSVSATALPGAVDTLSTWSGAVFPGESFPAGALVHRASDRYGNAIANPTVTVTLPDGWTLANGTITAPAHEAYDWITVTAGARDVRNSVKVLRNLSAYTWDATWGCGPMVVNGVTLDSARVTAVATFEYFPVAPATIFRADTPLLSYAGTALWYRAGGAVDTVAVQHTRLAKQSPGAIDEAMRVADAPLAYEGGNGECPGTTNQHTPFRMVAR